MSAVAVRGYGLLTGWGVGLQSLPDNSATAAAGRRIIPLAAPGHASERLRRATPECLLAVAAVEQALHHSQLAAQELAGPRTALVFASASSYAAANWAFLVGESATALHFPYTAPSAVPGEVTIQYGITGPYLLFLSGSNAGIEALWQAARLLTTEQCDRVLVLSVETFTACADLFSAGRWLLDTPLVETAACLILERHAALSEVVYRAGHGLAGCSIIGELQQHAEPAATYLCMPTDGEEPDVVQRLSGQTVRLRERLGTCLACMPLIGLMLAAAAGKQEDVLLVSRWWDDWSAIRWPGGQHGRGGRNTEGLGG